MIEEDRLNQPSPPGQEQELQVWRYATHRDQYPLWLDRVLVRLGLPVPVGIAVLVAGVYLTGLIMALAADFADVYIASPPVYLGCAGIALVLGVVRWSTGKVHHVFEQLRPIFVVTDSEYRAILDRWFSRLRRGSGHLLWMTVGVITVLVVVALTYSETVRQGRSNPESVGRSLFPEAWYEEPGLLVKFAIVGFYGLCCAALLSSAARLLCGSLLFLMDLRRLPVIPLPSVIRVRLRAATDLYVRIAGAWLVGVVLFGALFYGDYNALTNALMVILFLLAMFMFLIPQLIFRRFLLTAYAALCTVALREFHSSLGVRLTERQPSLVEAWVRSRIGRLDSLPEIVEVTSRPGGWVYDLEDVVGWLAVQAIALSAVLAQGFFGRFTGI